MKKHIYFILYLSLFSMMQQASAQGIQFKVELLSDSVTYRVSIKPSTTWTAPNNMTLGAQVTLVVPTGGFQANNLTSINGVWDSLPFIVAPAERPSKDYFVVYLTTGTALPFTANVETPLFTFKNTGVCTGILDLIDNTTDPFMPPNAQNLNVGNYITTRGGGGSSNNLWTGNYGAVADCRRSGPCAISNEVSFTVIPKPVVSVTTPVNTVCVGGGVTLSASVTGGVGCSIQWQNSQPSPILWQDISSATNNTYTTPALNNSLKYRARVSCTGLGCCN